MNKSELSDAIRKGIERSYENGTRKRPDRDPGHRGRTARRLRYGLLDEDFKRLIKAQDGRCAICRKPLKEDTRKTEFHVDHDHVTKAIRGLLCIACNTRLGWLEKYWPTVMAYLKKEG